MNRSAGFTLLEMLAAIAILALLGLSARQLLQTVMDTSEASLTRLQRLQAVDYAMVVLEQDFRQLVDRGQRQDGRMTEQALFTGEGWLDSDDQGIAFVRANWRNPGQRLPRSGLQRVAYRLRQGQLERRHDLMLDAPENSEPVNRLLLDGVSGLQFRFFYRGRWQDQPDDQGTLPEGLAVILTLNDLGVLERRFQLPGSWN